MDFKGLERKPAKLGREGGKGKEGKRLNILQGGGDDTSPAQECPPKGRKTELKGTMPKAQDDKLILREGK